MSHYLLRLERTIREQEELINELYDALSQTYDHIGAIRAELAAKLGEEYGNAIRSR